MSDYMEGVGRRIREARESVRPELSQEAAAHEAGVSVKQWGRWERGESAPRARDDETWERIARVVGVRVEKLRASPPEMLDPESEMRAQLNRIESLLERVAEAVGANDGAATQPDEDVALREALDRLPKPSDLRTSRKGTSAPRKRREAS